MLSGIAIEKDRRRIKRVNKKSIKHQFILEKMLTVKLGGTVKLSLAVQ